MKRDNSYLRDNKFAVGAAPNKTAFKKGAVPWNKGKKGYMGANKTSFKKGVRGMHWRPVGTTTIRKDKAGTQRKWIKYAEPNKWMEYYRFVWLEAGRSLKRGYVIHHVNCDSSDDRIENLISISRADHPKLHNRWNTKNIPTPNA